MANSALAVTAAIPWLVEAGLRIDLHRDVPYAETLAQQAMDRPQRLRGGGRIVQLGMQGRHARTGGQLPYMQMMDAADRGIGTAQRSLHLASVHAVRHPFQQDMGGT